MKAPKNKDAAENYIIALIGDIPGVGVPSDDDEPSERRQKMDNLKESTRLERRDDPLELQQVKNAPTDSAIARGHLVLLFAGAADYAGR